MSEFLKKLVFVVLLQKKKGGTHVGDVEESLVCFGVGFNPKISTFIPLVYDELRNPAWCVYEVLVINRNSKDEFVLAIFLDIC